MKALVLAGGTGARLRPFSYSVPKQLMPIVNRPLIEYVLDNVRALGIDEVGVIVGGTGPQIAGVLGDGTRFGVRITYLPQLEPKGLAHAVIVARDFLGDDDFVMYLGDNMLPDGIARVAERFQEHRPAAQVVVHKVADPRSFGVVELDSTGQVTRMVEKPQHPRSDLAIMGVYFFTKAIHAAVAAIRPSGRGELEITDAMQWLLDAGEPVAAAEYDSYWGDLGSVEDVLECNRRLLDGITRDVAVDVEDCEIIGPVVVEAGAKLRRSRIEGPTVVGADALIEDSHIGPYTTVGAGCVLRRTRVHNSVVLEGAAISGVDGLDGSLIGRSAVVAPVDDSAGLRLVIGDHTRVGVTAAALAGSVPSLGRAKFHE
jgi:glucose-1-phosphate thymidylyltransferase